MFRAGSAKKGVRQTVIYRTLPENFMRMNALVRSSVAAALPTLLFPLGSLPLPAATPAQVEQVVIVFKTHFDIGYTDMASNVVQRYRTTMIDQALEVVDQNRDLPPEQQFVWTLPGWPMQQDPRGLAGPDAGAQAARAGRRFKEGRFVVHALPFTTHTELLEPEDLVRGLGFSSRLSRAAGLPLPRDAKMTDVPCHSWILPTLLRHAGVDFLHLGCNAASRSPQVPPLFWWEGPGRLAAADDVHRRELRHRPRAAARTGRYRTWLALIHTGDNHGPPTPGRGARSCSTRRKQKLPGVKVRIGRLSDFADAILAEKAGPAGRARRHAGHLDSRADVRSRPARSWPATSGPPSRRPRR